MAVRNGDIVAPREAADKSDRLQKVSGRSIGGG